MRLKRDGAYGDGPFAPFLMADSCLAADALDRHGVAGAAQGLQRIGSAGRAAGRVVTVQLVPVGLSQANTRSHLGTAAISSAGVGDVIVVANRGDVSAAAWGGLLGRAAILKGVVGIVIDGAVRDVDELQEIGLPVFARGVAPRSARGRFVEIATQVPVEISGIAVKPGDWVVADGSGVVFIPDLELHSVGRHLVELMEAEDQFRSQIDKGEPSERVLDRRYENLARPPHAHD